MNSTSETLAAFRLRQLEISQVFLPEFIRFEKQDAPQKFRSLLELPGVTVNDTIHDQLRELMKLRNPSLNLAAGEIEALIERHLGGTPMAEYGVWVYYPWSKRLVHALDEREFVEVRTSRNVYKITEEERDALATKRIGVIGLSVGQSVSVTLAMERVCGEIRLADFDLLELTNLNRIRTGIHNLGLAKVYSVAREIAEIDPFIRVKCFPEGLHEHNLDAFFNEGGRLDLLVEESDGFDIKILSRYKARSLGVPVIMEASDRCMVDVERFDLEPDRKILHGIVKNLDVDTLKTLKTNEDKIPYMLDILGFEKTTARLRASMLEMKQTVSTWPQLASAVTMGGGITADVGRRILLNHFTDSGRYYVDIDELIGNRNRNGSRRVKQSPDNPLTPERMRSLANDPGAGEALDASDRNEILEAALSAPSAGNRQPWKWFCCGKTLHLFLDPAETMDHTDPLRVAAYISLGCALTSVVETARHLGYEASISFHENKEPLVASVSLGKKTHVSHPEIGPFVSKCHAAYGAGRAADFTDEQAALLVGHRHTEYGEVGLIHDPQRLDIALKLIAAGERARLLDEHMHGEYFSRELLLDEDAPPRGLSAKTLKLSPPHETALRVLSDWKVASLLSDWNKGSVIEKLALSTFKNTLAIGVVTAVDRTPASLTRAGMLAGRVWLSALKNSLSVQPIYLSLASSTGTNKAGAPSEKEIFGFSTVGSRLSALFNGLSGEAVFTFRVFVAESPTDPPGRAPLNELIFTC